MYVESDLPARKGVGPLWLAQRLQGEVQWHCGDQGIVLYLLPILQGGSFGFLVQPNHSIVTSILLQHRSQHQLNNIASSCLLPGTSVTEASDVASLMTLL